MARPKVRLHSSGVLDMLKDDGIREALQKPAEAVLQRAQSGAPVKSGAYRDSLSLEDDTTDRAVVRVGAHVPYGMTVEARTGVLARALGQEGG